MVLKLMSLPTNYFFPRPSEVTGSARSRVLRRARAETVIEKINEMKGVEFSLVIFVGHAASDVDENITLELEGGDELDHSHLLVGAPKRIAVFDCCRKFFTHFLTRGPSKVSARGSNQGSSSVT